jgi:sulfopyruvate decarboxylase subunit alpha
MALHTKAILAQLNIPTYHFHEGSDVAELPGILAHTQMMKKPSAILMDASFWRTAA